MNTSSVLATCFLTVFVNLIIKKQGELVALSPAVHSDLWPRLALPSGAVY